MIGGRNFFDKPINNDKITYDNIRKIAIGQGEDYTTGCLLNYIYFKEADANPEQQIQQINVTRNLEWDENTQMFFIIEEVEKTVLDFWKRPVEVLWLYFVLI